MESLLKFLRKIHFLLIFIVLETISLIYVIGSDVERSSVFFTSANNVAGFFYDIAWNYIGYFHLRDENEHLTNELAKLKNQSQMAFIVDTAKFVTSPDTTCKYRFISAQVLKNSTNRTNNFITLNVGEKHGVRPDMGVVSTTGAVGVVVAVSKNYSLAISILNQKIGLSAKLKNNNFYGSLIWPGENYQMAVLTEIPNHIELHEGDTVVTSGYSAIFPEGIQVATIKSFKKNSDDNFYSIDVKLSTDLKNLSNVFVIENKMQQEQKELENQADKFIQ